MDRIEASDLGFEITKPQYSILPDPIPIEPTQIPILPDPIPIEPIPIPILPDPIPFLK